MRVLAGFEKALEHMDPTSPEYMRASIGRCRALARLDPARGKAEFLKLADAQKSRIEFQDFHRWSSTSSCGAGLPTAVDMMESAKAMFPGSPKFKIMAEQRRQGVQERGRLARLGPAQVARLPLSPPRGRHAAATESACGHDDH
jgi:hypothetical protein